MLKRRNQRTLANTAVVEGFGYWTGKDVRVEFRPAPENTGLVFVRADLSPPQRIPALVEYRIEAPRRTTLRCGRGSVEMVEHILAALAGLQIDNCEIWVNNVEMPGCDGSSLAFVEALDKAGIVEQDAPRACLVLRDTCRMGDEGSWIEAHPASQAGFTVKFRLDYGRDNAIGRQTLEMRITPDAFRRELASARTFLLKAEAEWLRSQGLGTRATLQDLLVFDEEGPIDNTLRYPDECVRHKVLDLVGDFALAGCDIVGYVVAHRSGHRLSAELVRNLLSEGELHSDLRRSA